MKDSTNTLQARHGGSIVDFEAFSLLSAECKVEVMLIVKMISKSFLYIFATMECIKVELSTLFH